MELRLPFRRLILFLSPFRVQFPAVIRPNRWVMKQKDDSGKFFSWGNHADTNEIDSLDT